MQPKHLTIREHGPVARVTLARPEVRNAFNATLIAELHEAFESLGGRGDVRAIVLAGEGKAFCGGADVNWMQASLDLSVEENLEDARALSRMLRVIDGVPKPVIGRIQGAALGGGSGLAAVCDIAIAGEDAFFGFTEVKLGLIPAVISPFVVAKIGSSAMRALGLTGERFSAHRARDIGLVHEVVAENELDDAVERAVATVLTASPSAVAVAKELFARVAQSSYDDSLELTARAIAQQRTSPEGQEGLRAFLEKRRAEWVK
jgi:methylglutaconyl-CoA hydratase